MDVAVVWVAMAAPLVRARVEEAATRFPRRRVVELPEPAGISRLFMHEVAGIHRELFSENSDLYGEDLRIKIERCLAVTDAEAESASQLRDEYRELVENELQGIDLVVTPTLPCVAPKIGAGGAGDIDVREQLISRTPFQRARLARSGVALRAAEAAAGFGRCGGRETMPSCSPQNLRNALAHQDSACAVPRNNLLGRTSRAKPPLGSEA
jgi:Asp-tRNA(Asn)/Glu-tRNA(Gln) amidotransferase A subunit family amidase